MVLALDYAQLDRSFFLGPTEEVARKLLGKLLLSERRGVVTGGLIVETEAYLPTGDSACHAAIKRTKKNDAMFGEAGTAYVYPIHSQFCFNVVTEPIGVGAAVLIRAIEPTIGLNAMRRRRITANRPKDYCRGPGRLCTALAISNWHDRRDLTLGRTVWLADSIVSKSDFSIRVTRRIGVTSAFEMPLRFVVAGSEFASGKKSLR